MINNFKYTDKEMEELISSITILIDTREKQANHITDYFDRKEIKYKKKSNIKRKHLIMETIASCCQLMKSYLSQEIYTLINR